MIFHLEFRPNASARTIACQTSSRHIRPLRISKSGNVAHACRKPECTAK